MKMKKWLKSAAFAAIALCLVTFAVTAQDSATATTATDTATAVVEASTDVIPTADPVTPTSPLIEFFYSYAGLVLLIQIITGWLLKTVPSIGKTFKQVISWVVAVGIAYVGKLYGFGLFADAGMVETIATGIGLGMVANYLYDAKTLESIIGIFFANKKA